ncbi:hypothetical protein DNTS_004095 [Danionella cerebrum]|uniref:Uncharacterized protein n=1 Tax=Danionella cerebrum TaxID=2873325 RepID=A0A553MUG6_9TELE|nr:hypothetical protein DNTS_004095 [Danionella translucida]
MEACQISCSFYGCKRTYNSQETLDQHLQDHIKNSAQSLPGKAFLCSQIGCDGSFNSMQMLMEHMRHHYKPNNFFLCESCKAKLRSYRTLLKHLQTCAKVAKNKASLKTEVDSNTTSVPISDMEQSGAPLASNLPEEMESMPSLPATSTPSNMPTTQQFQESNSFTSPSPAGHLPLPIPTLNPVVSQTPPSQAESPFSAYPPSLSPVHPGFLADPSPQQKSPRSGPPSLSASPPLPPSPGTNAVWRKNLAQSFNCRILWEHTRGRYSCLQCGHCTPDRGEMTTHIENQHKNPGGKPNGDHVCKEPPYKVEESGYAGFLMPIEVYFKNKEEPKKVCFNYDLFLNLEGNPPVNHLRCEKLTFNNPTHEFRRKLVKAGGSIVVPEGVEMKPRPSPDYPMLPTIPLSAFSDPKKTKSGHAVKDLSKEGTSGNTKSLKAHKTKEHHERTRKDSESKTTSRESDRESNKTSRDQSTCNFSKKTMDSKGKDEKSVPKAAFKEPKLLLRESKMDGIALKGGGAPAGGGVQQDTRTLCKRPSSNAESLKTSTKKQKRMVSEGMKGSGYCNSSPRITSTTTSTYLDKKTSKDKAHWPKMKPEVQEVKRQPDSDESNSEEEASSKSEPSAPSSPSSSSSSSSSDSDFEPSQKQGQGPLRSMVEDMHTAGSDDDSSSEISYFRFMMDSESDGESRPPSQEAPSPQPKLSSANLKMLGKKSPDSCTREKLIKGGYDKIVNLIEKTGHFNITNTTFDFDLFSLDESTVRKLQSYLEVTST